MLPESQPKRKAKTLKEALDEVRDRISVAKLQCADPSTHAKQIVQSVLGFSPGGILLESQRTLSPVELDRLERFLARRLSGEPFQYIVGHEWFWKCPFEVGPGVLIPRPDTELLVETILRARPQRDVRCVELGAGSGNIGISVLRERPTWDWTSFEINPASAHYARRNAIGLLPTTTRYRIVLGDFFKGTSEDRFDIAVANPPYVVTSEIASLSTEVRHEPHIALDGGEDGLVIVRQFFDSVVERLFDRGLALCEVGAGQAPSLVRYLEATGWKSVLSLRDLSGIERVVLAERP